MTEPWISEIIANAAKNTYENVVKELDQLKAENEALQAQVAALVEALRWASGSRDFGPGGPAEEGWDKVCAPLLSDLQPTADAYTKREKAEAVHAILASIMKSPSGDVWRDIFSIINAQRAQAVEEYKASLEKTDG